MKDVYNPHIYASGPESQIMLAYLLLTPDPTLTPLFATPFAHARPHNAMHSPSYSTYDVSANYDGNLRVE